MAVNVDIPMLENAVANLKKVAGELTANTQDLENLLRTLAAAQQDETFLAKQSALKALQAMFGDNKNYLLNVASAYEEAIKYIIMYNKLFP